jgi:uncharacterized membrane protein
MTAEAPTFPPHEPRDLTVDIARGIAIVSMVAANLAGLLLAPPHPLWFRFFGSFAAPLFITISGMMVARGVTRRKRSLDYYLKRGATVVLIGAVLDLLLWDTRPFTTWDVLYLIGMSMPVALLLLRIRSTGVQTAIVVALFLATPLMQSWLGYDGFMGDQSSEQAGAMTDERSEAANKHDVDIPAVPAWHRCLVDGWFPVFPWLGFALLGALLGRTRLCGIPRGPARLGGAATTCLVLGVVGYLWSDTVLYTRWGYSEMFYPPTLWYIALATGVVFSILVVFDLNNRLAVYRPVAMLGKAALLIYIVHEVIARLLASVLGKLPLAWFLVVYAGVLAGLIVLAYALNRFKGIYQIHSLVVRVLLGGR